MTDDSRPPVVWLARALRRVGELAADQETRVGRLYARAESGLTRAAERLNHSESWLRFNGEVLRRHSGLRLRRRSLTEGALRALRLPTSSEVGELHEQIRHLEEQVGALGSQLEVAIELLERRGAASGAAPGREAPAAGGAVEARAGGAVEAPEVGRADEGATGRAVEGPVGHAAGGAAAKPAGARA